MIFCVPIHLQYILEEKNSHMVRFSFPSKLIDYTYLGLPILIQAPKSSSLVEFTEKNEKYKFAEVVVDNSENAVELTLDRLADEKYRKKLGKNALL